MSDHLDVDAPSEQRKSEDLYCIGWVITNGGYGTWQVRVARQGQCVNRNFSPSRHGGKAAALLAARAWRDEVFKQFSPMTNRQLRTVVRRNNSSGIPGVQRVVDGTTVYWRAALSRSGHKTLTALFRESRFGEDGARQRAIEARHMFLQQQPDRFTALTPLSQALCERDYGDAEQLTNGAMPVVWNPQMPKRQIDKLKKNGLLSEPNKVLLAHRNYPSRGPTWELSTKQADGRWTITRFPVKRYGEEEAQQLAEEACAQARLLRATP